MIKSKEERNVKDQQKLREVNEEIEEMKKEENKSSKYDFEMKKLLREKEALERLISQRNQEIRVIEEEEDNRMWLYNAFYKHIIIRKAFQSPNSIQLPSSSAKQR